MVKIPRPLYRRMQRQSAAALTAPVVEPQEPSITASSAKSPKTKSKTKSDEQG